eukprot:365053-Chlamydomonas_euryale.AAC.26
MNAACGHHRVKVVRRCAHQDHWLLCQRHRRQEKVAVRAGLSTLRPSLMSPPVRSDSSDSRAACGNLRGPDASVRASAWRSGARARLQQHRSARPPEHMITTAVP